MKKVLIIGTSHSAASCTRAENPEYIERMNKGRWHDYFKTELSYDVTLIARSGTTPQDQLMTVIAYLADNPHETWDLCIIEGRGIENTINMPWQKILDDYNPEISSWKDFYYMYQDRDDDYIDRKHMPFYNKSVTSESIKDDVKEKSILPWAINYVESVNQAIDTYGCNRAIISMIEERCPIVKFWIYSHIEKFRTDDKFSLHRKFGEELLEKWFLFGKDWVCNVDELLDLQDNETCECGHPNEAGHKRIWKELVQPKIGNLNE